jgi:hypothetical protein
MNAPASSVRVWVPDVWEVVELAANPGLTVAQLKTSALEQTIGPGARANPAEYVVKYRGALVADEQQTLGALNVPDKAPLIVLPAHRRPVI